MKRLNSSVYHVTDLIHLKLCQLEDSESLSKLIDKNRLQLRPWLNWVDKTIDVEDTRAFIRRSMIAFMQGEPRGLGIFYEGSLVGMMGLHPTLGEINLGYWLDCDTQGKGVVTTCCAFLIELCFTDHSTNRIIIRCAIDNFKSQLIPKRLGFTFEGISRDAQKKGEEFINIQVYSLIRSDLSVNSNYGVQHENS